MLVATVKVFAALKGMNQSDIAAAAGVSRQRVSQWFKETPEDGMIDVRLSHALKLASSWGVSVDELSKPLPLLNDEMSMRTETAQLLWDRLYPDVVSLFTAALNQRLDALARVAQVYGLYEAAKLFGSAVWRDFPRYKNFIKPARRSGLEQLWQYHQNQTNA